MLDCLRYWILIHTLAERHTLGPNRGMTPVFCFSEFPVKTCLSSCKSYQCCLARDSDGQLIVCHVAVLDSCFRGNDRKARDLELERAVCVFQWSR